MLAPMVGRTWSAEAGDIVEMDPGQARQLIAMGTAEPLEPETTEAPAGAENATRSIRRPHPRG